MFGKWFKKKQEVDYLKTMQKLDIKDGDIIVLKITDSAGADIAFTATINTVKTQIVITPNVSFNAYSDVYVSINNFEDYSGNEVTSAYFAVLHATTTPLTFSSLTAISASGTTYTSTAGSDWNAYGLANESLTGAGAVEFECPTVESVMIGFNTSNTNQGFAGYERAVFIYTGTFKITPILNGSAQAQTTQTVTVNSKVRLKRDSSNVVTIEFASDGVTFSTVYTFAGALTGTLYININLGAGKRIYNPSYYII